MSSKELNAYTDKGTRLHAYDCVCVNMLIDWGVCNCRSVVCFSLFMCLQSAFIYKIHTHTLILTCSPIVLQFLLSARITVDSKFRAGDFYLALSLA